MYKYIAVFLASVAVISSATAAPIFWTDWTSNANINGVSTTVGNIVTPGRVINITYENANGIAGAQLGNVNDRDYYANGSFGSGGRDDSISPYTSSAVDNAPTNTDIVRLQFAGEQTLSFSESIANLVFTYVSLNAENWNGFTVGVQGTESEVDGELSSPAIGLFLIAGFGLLLYRKK